LRADRWLRKGKREMTPPSVWGWMHPDREPSKIRVFFIAMAFAASALTAGAQPTPQPKVGACPSGYRESGGYCAPTSERAPIAIPKQGQCPSGFASEASYCVEMKRRR
jgi:hypothetical protein